MEPASLLVRPADFPVDLAAVRELFLAYGQLPEVAECVTSLDREIAGLPGRYCATEGGALLIALHRGAPAGCVGYLRLDEETCEMRRLFVSPQARGLGFGSRLVDGLLRTARQAGYQTMRLHTLPVLASAVALYVSAGFHRIDSYDPSAPAAALFFERAIRSAALPGSH
jgi:GNAT superfamily N-acetyltransferase